ncbi:hypothetical protein Sjap_012101 [Stephania japonica]|uniref:FHA domain-containing protein n=1 Tax=Stephania japonica TaxID=461633 RepID=A0AAP0NXY8_9MAGN
MTRITIDMAAAAAAAAALVVTVGSRHSSISILNCRAKHPLTTLSLQRLKARQLNSRGAVCFSADSDDAALSPDAAADRWLLQPIGDGDTRHIGFKVPMPPAFEISSSAVNVGRVPEKADVVIPVATVSALHARIEKSKGRLLVTDLDSTNGTFINEKRLRPGDPAAALPGNKITFGDTHLAIFLVSKLDNVNLPSKPDE